MSIANVLIQHTAAVLVTDTNVTIPSVGFVGHAAKVRTFPARKFAVASRGLLVAMARFGDALKASPPPADFAKAGPHLTRLAQAARDATAHHAEAIRDTLPVPPALADCLDALQITAVGWSEKRRRPVGFYIVVAGPDYAGALPLGCHELPVGRYQSTPGFDGFAEPDWSPNDRGDWEGQFVAIADRQREIAEEMGAPLAVGGSLVATFITRQGITQRVIHRYPEATGEGEPGRADSPDAAEALKAA
ncbi:hypothetical protein [Rhodocista pekingensis]|uniref:Uncharacterized protein n=1 Tax=Rhodocista pekingensis TaxID=201185 RepID=A0ABW2KU52_9PROT